MEISVQGGTKRAALLLGSLSVFALLVFQALHIWMANRRIESGRLEAMQRGAALAPGNGEAWDRIGRFWQLDFANPDANAAIQNYLKAVQTNPNSSFYWLDLASAYEDVGDLDRAQAAFDKAEAAYPISALVAWNYGNFLVRAGKNQAGYAKVRNAVTVDPKLLPLAISRTWRSGENVDELLNEALPANREAYLQALKFFTELRQPDAALKVWNRLAALGQHLPMAESTPFQDILIANDRSEDSRRVWRDALGLAGVSTEEPANRSLMWNGDFGADFANGGLDWRWAPITGVSASFDAPAPSSTGRSVRLDFGGGANISLEQPAQYVPVEPEHMYRFRARVRTEQVTTESGVQFSIVDPNHAGAVSFSSDNFTGTHPWTLIEGKVTTGSQTHFLWIRLVRIPSRLFENKINGTVWISDVSLLAAAGETTKP